MKYIAYLKYRLIDQMLDISSGLDKISLTEETAADFAHENLNPDLSDFTDPIGWGYDLTHIGADINNYLREHELDNSRSTYGDLDTRADNISRYIDCLHAHKRFVVYRGVYSHTFDQMIRLGKDHGCDLYDPGFLQTALVKGREEHRDYQLRILVPKGSHAVYLGSNGIINPGDHYHEVDIQRGASLQILSIGPKERTLNGSVFHYINCRLLSTEPL